MLDGPAEQLPQPQHELNGALVEYRNLFVSKREGVARTLKAASQTPNGNSYRNAVADNITFDNFLSLPQVTPEQLAGDVTAFMVPGENTEGYTVQTSGSSGVRKEVRYSKKGMIAQLDQDLIKEIDASRHPILLVDRDSVDSTSHTVLKRSFEALAAKKVETESFTFPGEALDAILKGDSDLVYANLNPILVNLLLDGLIQLKAAGDPRISQLMGRKFFLETGGDAIGIDQIKDWDKKVTELFGEYTVRSRILAFYAQSEQLMIGRYDYQAGDSEVKYKVGDRKLCIIFDENGIPVIGRKGRLEVTDLIDSSESIQGTTVLPRYLTGDLATLSIENGEYYLTGIERDPERALFSVMGEKIFLSMFPTELDKVGLSDIKLEFQEITTDGNKRALRIIVIPRPDQSPEETTAYIDTVASILLEQYPSLKIPIRTGLLKVRVELGTGSFEKRWRLLPTAIVPPEEYDRIENTVKFEGL